jgi:hypothetical protein
LDASQAGLAAALPNVTGKPRFSVVRIEEGKYAGNTVWAVADQVIPRPPR